jgi:hypothetical protein
LRTCASGEVPSDANAAVRLSVSGTGPLGAFAVCAQSSCTSGEPLSVLCSSPVGRSISNSCGPSVKNSGLRLPTITWRGMRQAVSKQAVSN